MLCMASVIKDARALTQCMKLMARWYARWYALSGERMISTRWVKQKKVKGEIMDVGWLFSSWDLLQQYVQGHM